MTGIYVPIMTFTSSNNPLTILHLEGDTQFSKKINQLLTSANFKTKVVEASSRKQFVEQLKQSTYDLIFLSDSVSDCGVVEALKTLKKMKVFTPALVFSDILDEETIVKYINLGAADYILKTSLDRLVSVIKKVVSNSRNTKTVDYQTFFESSADLFCVCDREGHFTAINKAWGEIFGFTDAEMINKPFVQFVYPDDQKSAAAQFQKMFDAKGKSSDLTCRFVTHAGDPLWLQWRMKIQDDGSINAVVRDVTETKQREVQISQAHQNLQKLVELYKADIVKKTLVADQIRDSVVVTDLKGIITSWNKGSEKVFGYKPEEVVGQHIAIIYPEKDYKYIQEEATNVLLEQGEKEFQLHMRRKSGEDFEARLTLEVTRDSDGKVNGMLGYAIDMGPVREDNDIEKNKEEAASEIAAQEAIVQEDNENQVSAQEASVNEPTPTETEQPVIEPTPVESEQEPVAQETVTELEVAEKTQVQPEIKQEVVEISVASTEVSLMYLEDSLKNINLVENMLSQRPNYRLITTQEPEDCVDMARQYLPTLILLDLDHSEADGFELFKQLRQEEKLKSIPIVAVSSEPGSEKNHAAKSAGFADYLVKPFETDAFLSVVDSLLHGSNAEVSSAANSSK